MSRLRRGDVPWRWSREIHLFLWWTWKNARCCFGWNSWDTAYSASWIARGRHRFARRGKEEYPSTQQVAFATHGRRTGFLCSSFARTSRGIWRRIINRLNGSLRFNQKPSRQFVVGGSFFAWLYLCKW